MKICDLAPENRLKIIKCRPLDQRTTKICRQEIGDCRVLCPKPGTPRRIEFQEQKCRYLQHCPEVVVVSCSCIMSVKCKLGFVVFFNKHCCEGDEYLMLV